MKGRAKLGIEDGASDPTKGPGTMRQSPGALARAERRGGKAAATREKVKPRPGSAASAKRQRAGAVQKGVRLSKDIEAATTIVPLWVAEGIAQEASLWLGTNLPKDSAAALVAKAERCFAGHRQFHRLVSSRRDGGNAGIEALRRFMRHWLASRLKRERPALFRRLPWDYAMGVRLDRRRSARRAT